jgi:hypothetical protein
VMMMAAAAAAAGPTWMTLPAECLLVYCDAKPTVGVAW